MEAPRHRVLFLKTRYIKEQALLSSSLDETRQRFKEKEKIRDNLERTRMPATSPKGGRRRGFKETHNLSRIKKMNYLTVFFFPVCKQIYVLLKDGLYQTSAEKSGGTVSGCYPPTVCFGHSSKSQRAYGSNIRSAGNKPVKAVCPFCSHVNKLQFLESYFGSATVREFRDFYPH